MSSGPVEFLDVNATIGRLSAPKFGSWLSALELLAEMDRFGIGSAAVGHSYGRELDAARGNLALLSALEQTRNSGHRLIPVATLFPAHGMVDPSVEEQLLPFNGQRILAARLHPNPTHDVMDEDVHPRHYPFVPEVVGSVCEYLAGLDIPLFLDIAEVRWEEVYVVCRDFPTLSVVMLGVSYTHKRSLYAGLYRYRNLHFEISGFHAQEGIEEAVSTFGASQLLFGTRLPTYTAASAIAMVQYAAIDEADKILIAAGNAVRLFSGTST